MIGNLINLRFRAHLLLGRDGQDEKTRCTLASLALRLYPRMSTKCSSMTLDWLAETSAAAIDIPQHRLRTIGSAPPSAIWTARCSSVTSGLEVPRQLIVASLILCRRSFFHFLNRDNRMSVSPSCSHFGCDPNRLHQLFLRGAVP